VRSLAQARSAATFSAITTDSGRVRLIFRSAAPVSSGFFSACTSYSAATMACSISAPEKPSLAAARRARSKAFGSCLFFAR